MSLVIAYGVYLWLYVAAAAIIAGAVTLAVIRTCARPLWRVVVGAIPIGISAVLCLATIGLFIVSGGGHFPEDPKPTFVVVVLLTLGGAALLPAGRRKSNSESATGLRSLTRSELTWVGMAVLVAAAVAVYALPVLDCHYAWGEVHCHTLVGTGNHLH